MADIKRITDRNGTFYYDFDPNHNDSFLQTAKELQTVGIKNYYFMLKILNPRVADIDPFKPNITRQEIQLLMQECYHNMWFFARRCVRMRTGKGIVPFCLHRGITASMWCFEHHQDYCLTEPRQTYKTTGNIGGPILWAFQLAENMQMHFFGKETDNTKRNLSHLKSNIELLPEWMQFRRYISEDGKVKKTRQSTEIMRNDLRHNVVEIHPKPTSLGHAQSLGRGGSGNILYMDEIEHTPYVGEVISNSAPLYKTASENAAAVGAPYCRIFTCTPGNLDTKEGRDSYPIIQSMIPWTEKIYDMTPEQIKSYKEAYTEEYHNDETKEHSRNVIDVFYIEYQYYQVRKDYQWVMDQYNLSGDRMEIRREILMQRLRGSTESPIDPEDIEYLISNMTKSTKELIINDKWLFKLYPHGQGTVNGKPKDLDENIPYLVGIDPASGGGGDNFAITILNPFNLQIAAEFKSRYIPGTYAVKMLVTLVTEYIPKAVLIPEKNSMGAYLIQMIVDQTSIADNLYWSEKEAEKQLKELTEEGPEDMKLKEMATKYKKYGTWTSPKVRKAMFELLFQHVEQAKQVLNTEYLVDDICKLVRTSTGRIEADKGEHDDSLMSYLHTLYVYYYGDNLHRFGIDRQVNPVLGEVQPDREDQEIQQDSMKAYFEEKPKTFQEMVMDSLAEEECRIKELVAKFPQVHDGVYSRYRDMGRPVDPYHDTVDIGINFFDTINGL